MAIRGLLRTACGSGVPSKPTRSTSTPLDASACAWYSMRAQRPRSPSATTVALIRERSRGGGNYCMRSDRIKRSASADHVRQQVRRDAPAIDGGRSKVVDGRDLVDERLLSLDERGAARERSFGAWRPHHCRRDAAERDACVNGPTPRRDDAG